MYYRLLHAVAVAAVAAGLFASCEGMNDRHRGYLEGGEKIYAPRVDSLCFFNGKNRVLMQFWLRESPNVRSVDVFWNSDADSLSVPVTPNPSRDSMEVFIPLAEEKSYTFYVRTTDMFGNHSLRVLGSATSLGDMYASLLTNRAVKSAQATGPVAEIQWYSAADDFFCTEVRYMDTGDELRTVRTFSGETLTRCPDPKPGSLYEYRSLYVPVNSIDTFYTEWERISPLIRFDRTGWSIVSFSDQRADDGGGVNALLDGNLDTYWHSQWGPNAPLPHWAVIDMLGPKEIRRFDTYRKRGITHSKTVIYSVSDDPDPDASSWVKIAEGMFPASGDLLSLTVTATAQGRYLKIYLPDSNSTVLTTIAEIYVDGIE